MTPEQVFDICGKLVLPAWLLLIVLPKWEWTRKLVFHAWIPMLLGIAYVYCFYHAWPFPEGGGFGSLQEVMIAFTSPWLVMAGWIHYLAFDLFIGAWVCRTARNEGIKFLPVIPCLFLTFLFGPIGFLIFQALRYTANVLSQRRHQPN